MKKVIYGIYAPNWDMTFVMEDTHDKKGNLIYTECVGWYHGEPTEKDNNTFKGKLKASYKWLL